MVILTLGELLTAPTASAYVVNMAPPAQRGRYLGLFGLTWQAATAIGPLAAGFLSDAVSMRAPWVAGALVGLASAAAFLALDRFIRARPAAN
jgi:MFS family permease